MIAGALVVAILILLPGSAAWLAFGRPLEGKTGVIERGFTIVFAGLLLVSWPALVLAELNRFSLINLSLILALFVLAATTGWVRDRHRERPLLQELRARLELPLLVIAGAAAVGLALAALYGPPSQYVIGGRDHGVYVNTGVHIARSGGILVIDEALVEVPAASRLMLTDPTVDRDTAGLPGPWSQGVRLSGFTIRDLSRGLIAPHAFHLYPAWFALFYAAGGLDLLLWPTFLFALLGLWAVGSLAARLYGRPVATIAALLLAANLVQIWFGRYPTAEILLQPLFWGGAFAFVLWVQSESRLAAVLAGAGFGLMHLAKLDTVFVPVFLLLFCGIRWLAGRPARGGLAFWLPYGLLLIHTAIHALAISTIYFIDHAVRVLLPGFLARRLAEAAADRFYPADILRAIWAENSGAILAAAAALIAAAAGLILIERRLRKKWPRLPLRFPRLQIGLAIPLAGAFLLLYFSDATGMELVGGTVVEQLGWYLTPGVLGLALFGFALRAARAGETGESFTLGLIFANIAPFFLLGMGTTGDHFWAIRRFVPVLVPAVMMFAALTLDQLRLKRPSSRLLDQAIPIAGTAILLLVFWQRSAPFARLVEFDGLIPQLTGLAAQSRPGDIYLFEITRESVEFGTPLWLIYDRPVYLIESERKGDPAISQAVESWRAAGREVYWVSQRGVRDIAFPGQASTYTGSAVITGPRMEQPVDAVPERVDRYTAPFDLFKLEPAGEDLPLASVETFFIGYGLDQGVISGLYPSQEVPGDIPRRWTGGQVVLRPVVSGRPVRLLIYASSPRPAEAPAPLVSVQVNGREIGTFTPQATGALFAFPLDLPPEETDLEIILTSPVWNPPANGYNFPGPDLGFNLTLVKIVTVD